MVLSFALVTLLVCPAVTKAEVTNTAPNFKEVYDLIRTHLAGETQADLDRAAVQGLLNQLHAKVSLAAGPSETNSQPAAQLLAKSALYEGPIGYLRVGHVGKGLAGRIAAGFKEFANTIHLKGLILDLRFADGHDYAAAASVADLFLEKETPLLDWGDGLVSSKAKSDAISIPVAVLVNQQTAAAAEALAAILRDQDRALVLGSKTAGEATMAQEFPLSTGQRLRIATALVKLGDGATLSADGVTPDIQVAVNAEDEKVYYADPFKEISKPLNLVASLGAPATNSSANGGTNRTARIRPTEADLIRERKERPGMELDYSVSANREPEAEKPVIRDPVLGRGLDLIKGISVLHPSKPS
ncbi:MAG: Peptidase [Pedosphaera sp.]|nr:Peptidase [Pedosphaera sp.]